MAILVVTEKVNEVVVNGVGVQGPTGAGGGGGGAYVEFDKPFIFHATGNTVNGVVQSGDIVMVRIADNTIFTGKYLGSGDVTDYTNQSIYLELG